MKTNVPLLSSARIHKKDDDSKLNPPLSDHRTCRHRGKDAAAHDDSDLVGRPLLWMTNVWNPHFSRNVCFVPLSPKREHYRTRRG